MESDTSMIREITISSVGEPAHVKLEKNTKGYNFELSLYGDDLNSVLDDIFKARLRVEQEIQGIYPKTTE